jgi:hypothetical protein
MEKYMTEISTDEQRDICGGDWFDTSGGWLEALVLVIGFL